MNIHKNARLTPVRREEMALSVIEGRLSKARAARSFGVSAKIVARWVERCRAEGRAGMADRSSRQRQSVRSTPESAFSAGRRSSPDGVRGPEISPHIVASVRHRWGLMDISESAPFAQLPRRCPDAASLG